MKISSHFIFWLSIWGILFLVSPLLLSTDGQVGRIKDEIRSIEVAFGSGKAKEIVIDTSKIYRTFFIDTGILTEENKLYTRQSFKQGSVEELTSTSSKELSNATNSYLRALSVNVYGILIRCEIFMHWFIFILPFVAASFVDGFVTRKVKFSQFGYMSPMAYSMSLHFILFLLFIPLLYLVAPLPISPYFMPGWALLMALPINLLVSNTQRLFND